MCGILFLLVEKNASCEDVTSVVYPQLLQRGPDAYKLHKVSCKCFDLYFHGTILHLRGDMTTQPLTDSSGDVLLWNGEVFGGIDIPENGNDTRILFEKLKSFKTDDEFVRLFSILKGPWSFVYFNATQQKLWFGRDFFGRRSLVRMKNRGVFMLSSLGHREFEDHCTEVDAKLLYCMDLACFGFDSKSDAYTKTYSVHPTSLEKRSNLLTYQHRCMTDCVATTNGNISNEILNKEVGRVVPTEDALDTSDIKDRDTCLSCCKSFSRGAKATQCQMSILNENHPNKNSTAELKSVFVNRGNSICCGCLHAGAANSIENESVHARNCGDDAAKSTPLCSGDHNTEIATLTLSEMRNEFLRVLKESVKTRVFNIPRSQADLDHGESAKVGILFSGGIDSVILAALAHMTVPLHEPIDLINVAFEQKVKTPQNVKKKHQKPLTERLIRDFDVPDRISGKTALLELAKERKWNFIEVDVTLEELQQERASRIANLVYPLNSVLDDSIGCAIWFAARGRGKRYAVSSDGEIILREENYLSPVKVLLTGMGADEQLGGYARHRTKFEHGGWVNLISEMKMEISRISSRNLGRDDRCISDHGREARFPFLDEQVVSFLNSIPTCVKCDPRLPRGQGEKILLREVARMLSLPYASILPKRAIQFGSKIAKLESTKEKGSDSCTRLEKETFEMVGIGSTN